MRPVLHDATEQRTTVVPTGISLRQVAHTKDDTRQWYHEPSSTAATGYVVHAIFVWLHLCNWVCSASACQRWRLLRQQLIERTAHGCDVGTATPHLAHVALLVKQHNVRNRRHAKNVGSMRVVEQQAHR